MPGADTTDPHALTLATARGRRLCKTRHATGAVQDYDAAYRFVFDVAEAADLDALAALLRDLESRRDTCVLRGAVRDQTRARGVRRLLHPDHATGEAPTLAEVPRAWLALDFDSLPLPPDADPRDLGQCGDLARAVLPAAFHRAGCVVAATAGHGFKPGARLRLWFLLSRPLTGAECKRWLRAAPVDRTVFGAVQPIYTAAPVFVGMVDPLPVRLARLDGAERVDVPHPAALAPPPRPPLRKIQAEDVTARFAALIRLVRDAREGERHPKLYWAACRAGELVAAGEVDGTRAAEILATAAMDGGGADRARALATAQDGIAQATGSARR